MSTRQNKALSNSVQAGDEAKAVFYAATDGNDNWSGQLAEPNAQRTDGPFATLHQARDAVRRMKKEQDGLKEPVTVMVRGGKYFMDSALVLNQEDSGTQDCPITYTAYPGEKPILSGGRRIIDWKPYKGKILQCALPDAKGGKWKFRQLFCNGKRMQRARWPKCDPKDPIHTGWAFTEAGDEQNPTTAFLYKPGTFRRHWAKPTEVEVNVFDYVGWLMKTIPIKRIDEDERTITLAYESWEINCFPWHG